MSSPPEFSFPVNELDAGGRQFAVPVRPAWLRGALEGMHIGVTDHDGLLDVRLSRSGTDVIVRGTVAADLVVPCSRCLEPATVPVREEVSLLAVPKAAGTVGPEPKAKAKAKERKGKSAKGDRDSDVELAAEEADVVPYEGDTLVLDGLVRDELLLGIPMIPLCSEACPGIRPGRSRADNDANGDSSIDPRLRPLLDLKHKS